MRDLLLLFVVAAMVLIALHRPLAGYLFWGWASLIAPSGFAYSYMHDARIPLILAVATFLSSLFRVWRLRLGRLFNPSGLLLVLFLCHASLSSTLAPVDNTLNDELMSQFAKTCLFALVMPLFVNQEDDIHALTLTIALGLGFHGVNEGLKVLVTGGSHSSIGVPMTMLGDNNQFAVAVAMVLPLLLYLGRQMNRPFVRLSFILAAGLGMCAILGSRSRGGLIALLIVLISIVLLSHRRLGAGLAVALLVAAFLQFTPDSWMKRYETISATGEDSSFMHRVVAWKVSSAAALDHPVFGTGFHGIQFLPTWERYRHEQGLLGFVNTPEPNDYGMAAHSIYFEVLGDMGFVGLSIYLLLFARAMSNWFWIRAKSKGKSTDLVRSKDLSDAIAIALFAFLVGGASLSLAYYETPYVLLVLLELVRMDVHRQLAAQNAEVKL